MHMVGISQVVCSLPTQAIAVILRRCLGILWKMASDANRLHLAAWQTVLTVVMGCRRRKLLRQRLSTQRLPVSGAAVRDVPEGFREDYSRRALIYGTETTRKWHVMHVRTSILLCNILNLHFELVLFLINTKSESGVEPFGELFLLFIMQVLY